MASTAPCYKPDGTVEPGWEPCNSTEGGNISACCDLTSSLCTTTGLCVGSAGYLYRGGCTDRFWNSPRCGYQCTNVNVHGFANLYPCAAGVYDYNHLFCCGPDGNINCCDKNFTIDWGASYIYGTSWTPSNASSNVSSNASLNSSSVSASSIATVTQIRTVPSSPSPTTVGIAVGILLLVLLLTLLGCAIYRERQWRESAQVIAPEKGNPEKDTPNTEFRAPHELPLTMPVNEFPE